MKKWYAVITDRENKDLSQGSRSLVEAEKLARELGEKAFIAVYDDSVDPPVCLEEITQDQFETK